MHGRLAEALSSTLAGPHPGRPTPPTWLPAHCVHTPTSGFTTTRPEGPLASLERSASWGRSVAQGERGEEKGRTLH